MIGMHITNKDSPYCFDTFFQPAGHNKIIGKSWASLYFKNGFNLVRLGIFWSDIEPTPGNYDDEYLKKVREITRVFSKHGIFTALVYHQDNWAKGDIPGMLPYSKLSGGGNPVWSANYSLNGVPQTNTLLPFQYAWFESPALIAIWDDFWNNEPA